MQILTQEDAHLMLRQGELRTKTEQLQSQGYVLPRVPDGSRSIEKARRLLYKFAILVGLYFAYISSHTLGAFIIVVASTIFILTIDFDGLGKYNKRAKGYIFVSLLILCAALRFILLTVM